MLAGQFAFLPVNVQIDGVPGMLKIPVDMVLAESEERGQTDVQTGFCLLEIRAFFIYADNLTYISSTKSQI